MLDPLWDNTLCMQCSPIVCYQSEVDYFKQVKFSYNTIDIFKKKKSLFNLENYYNFLE